MNNLHRSLAPISDAAWEQIDDQARDSFTLLAAGRRVVDVPAPGGPTLGSIDLGHLDVTVPAGDKGGTARLFRTQPLVRVRVPFTVSREEVDDVERGALDLTWDSVGDAAEALVDIEDRAVLHGWAEAGIVGLTQASVHQPVSLPKETTKVDDAVTKAVNVLRLAEVEGPYDLVLPQELYTWLAETTDHGRPVAENIKELLFGGDVLWAPAAQSALLVSRAEGNASLYLGRDVSVGYLSHDAETVSLYLEESFTARVHQPDCAVELV